MQPIGKSFILFKQLLERPFENQGESVTERFGDAELAKNCTAAIIAASGAPTEFSAEALAEAAAIDKAGIHEKEKAQRLDLRDRIIFTIDSADTKDIDDAISLTRTEFDVLAALSSRPAVVFTRHQLLESIWGDSWVGNAHLVDVHVGHLRRKLGDDPADPRYVITVRGVGYRMGSGS